MSASWTIERWPELGFHAFLSHCAENRDRLVMPVFQELQRRKLIPWFDRHHYPLATDPFGALRNNLLRCRHVIYFITPQLLRQGRGWCATERTLAELIHAHFRIRELQLWNFELPLLFVDRTDLQLQRSVYASAASLGVRCPHPLSQSKKCINWSVEQIQRLIEQQYVQTEVMTDSIRIDESLHSHIDSLTGLLRRVTTTAPDPIEAAAPAFLPAGS